MTVIQVNIHEAKTNLSRLLQRVLAGEEVIIARAGRPIAVLTPYEAPPTTRAPGDDADSVVIAPDFDAPLTEFEL